MKGLTRLAALTNGRAAGRAVEAGARSGGCKRAAGELRTGGEWVATRERWRRESGRARGRERKREGARERERATGSRNKVLGSSWMDNGRSERVSARWKCGEGARDEGARDEVACWRCGHAAAEDTSGAVEECSRVSPTAGEHDGALEAGTLDNGHRLGAGHGMWHNDPHARPCHVRMRLHRECMCVRRNAYRRGVEAGHGHTGEPRDPRSDRLRLRGLGSLLLGELA